MEIEGDFSKEENISVEKTTTPLSDVVMDIQEEPEDTPIPASGTLVVSGEQHLSAPEEIASSRSPESVAMETDEEVSPSETTVDDSSSR